MNLLLAYLDNRLQIFHHKQVVNKGAHVIVCGETYCYSYQIWGHRTVNYVTVYIFSCYLAWLKILYC